MYLSFSCKFIIICMHACYLYRYNSSILVFCSHFQSYIFKFRIVIFCCMHSSIANPVVHSDIFLLRPQTNTTSTPRHCASCYSPLWGSLQAFGYQGEVLLDGLHPYCLHLPKLICLCFVKCNFSMLALLFLFTVMLFQNLSLLLCMS